MFDGSHHQPFSRTGRPATDGKFLRVGHERFLVKGVSYGTFVPQENGSQFPSAGTIDHDFRLIASLGFNTVRVYTPPTGDVLDAAVRHGLRLMVGLPWTQHVAFLDDRRLRRRIRAEVVSHVRALCDHPAVLLFALGNEIPPGVVRWHGAGHVERFLRGLYDDAKDAAPDSLFTYVNYPPTDYLNVSCFDLCAFNVFLHEEGALRAYLARVQQVAADRPLLVAEVGADSLRHGLDGQAELVAMQMGATFAEGTCGAVAFTWTDDWWRGGARVDDWAFGLVDEARRPKPAALRVARTLAAAPHGAGRARQPRVSVVVCVYNAAATIGECLEALARLTYPDVEVIVVDDGSTDGTGDIARRHAVCRVIEVGRGGLSAARNIGLRAASGEVVAYCDGDVRVDPQWLDYLVPPFDDPDVVGAGGPNVSPPDDPWLARCVAQAPGAPTHVLLTDRVAEHVPGCNMAFRREALLAIGGFNEVFVRAGDDVDVCWRLQAHGGRLAFAASALVWHRHRASIGAYWRQQVGYGEGEAWLRLFHPDKFAGGHIRWRGLVYSHLPLVRSLSATRVHTGIWGDASFPSVYRTGELGAAHLPHTAAWQCAAVGLLFLGGALVGADVSAGPWLAATGVSGVALTVGTCLAWAWDSDMSRVVPSGARASAPCRMASRAVIAWLHVVQPLARFRGRLRGMMRRPVSAPPGAWPDAGRALRAVACGVALAAGGRRASSFWSESFVTSHDVLGAVVDRLRTSRAGDWIDVDAGWWSDRDVSVRVAPGARLDLRGLVEYHGGERCLVRLAMRLHAPWWRAGGVLLVGGCAVAVAAGAASVPAGLAAAAVIAGASTHVGRRVTAVQDTVRGVAERLGLYPMHVRSIGATHTARRASGDVPTYEVPGPPAGIAREGTR